ncbi:hypothetical protein RB653_009303 [Dictyostelium firmibasis]|uniref:FNIP repeat-containing protein n=1 Tax=Dictyostelium firmibasis TaxID=79012 RepID=A0AAN7UE26_9MYCE
MEESKENNILFFKIWRNIVIKEIIFEHLRLFKRNYYFKISDLNGFINKKNKYYVKKIEINFSKEISNDTFSKYLNCTNLIFSNKFNKSINNLKITCNLKHIEFGNTFDQPINPLDQIFLSNNSIETIKFGNNFNQLLKFNSSSINNEQFIQLKSLKLGMFFNKPLLEIPNSITDLEFGREFNQNFSFDKESKLKSLKFIGKFDMNLTVGKLPSSLKILYLSNDFSRKLTKGMLPDNLEELYFSSNYNQELIPNESIPLSLTLIKLSFAFNKELVPGVFPPNIKTIIFGESFSKPLKIGVIPNSVTTLKLPKFYKPFLTYLPQRPQISELYSIPPNSYKNLTFF